MHAHHRFAPVFLVLACGLLGACVSAPRTSETAPGVATGMDTIAVPRDTGMLAQGLRRSLDARGWRLTDYDAGRLEQTRDYQALARRARYRLTLSSDRIGDCRSGDPSFLYNVAVIENQSGRVPLALTGANCLRTAIGKFEQGLDRKQLIAPEAATSGR